MLRTFLDGRSLQVEGLDDYDLPPESASAILVDTVGFEREFTRVDTETAKQIAEAFDVTFSTPVELKNGASVMIGTAGKKGVDGYGILLEHPSSPGDCLITVLGPKANIEQLLADLSTTSLGAVNGSLSLLDPGVLAPVSRKGPEVSQIVPGVGYFSTSRTTPSTRTRFEGGGAKVAGGTLYRKTEGVEQYLILDGGDVVTRLFADAELEDLDKAVAKAASLVIELV